MLYRLIKNIKNNMLSIHFILGTLLGITGYLLYLKNWITTSINTKLEFGLLEPFVYGATDKFATTISAIGLIIAVSNVPFAGNNIMLSLYRCNKIRFVLEKAISTVIITAIYAISQLLIIVTLSLPFSCYRNEWSVLMQSCTGKMYGELMFTNKFILTSFLPLQLFTLSFFLNLLYLISLSLVLLTLCFFINRIYAFSIVFMFHAFQYAMHKKQLSETILIIYDDVIMESYSKTGLNGIIAGFIVEIIIIIICFLLPLIFKSNENIIQEEKILW